VQRHRRWFAVLVWPLASAAARAEGPDVSAQPPHRVGTVTVTATRAERDVLEVPGNVTVIDREAIEASGFDTVAQLLRREPGLFVTATSTSPDGFTVEARGFNDGGGEGSSLLVLVNGRRVNEPDSSVTDWAALRLDDVERIEIMRGPASALYGDNAIGGVVQILTRSGEGPVRGEVTGRAGSWDRYGGSFFGGGSQGPIAASLFVDGLTSDGYRDRSDYDAWSVEGTLRATLAERVVVGFDAGYGDDDRKRPGALSPDEIRDLGRRAAAPGTEDDGLSRRRWHLDGLVDGVPAEGVAVELRPFYREREDDTLTTAPATADGLGFRSEGDNAARSAGLNAQVRIDRPAAGLASRLIAGVDLLREQFHSRSDNQSFDADGNVFFSLPGDAKTRREVYGIFVQEELDLTSALRLSAGVRFDYARMRGRDRLNDVDFSLRERIWSPRAALTWRAAEPLAFYTSYSRGFRLPNIDEAFGFFGFNPGLDVQTSDAWEIGGKLRTGPVSANLTAYWMNVHDQIVFDHEIDDPDSGFPSPRNVNFDRVRHRGIESWLEWRPVRRVALWGTYTLNDSEIRRDPLTGLAGRTLPITPRNRGNLGLRATLPGLPEWVELQAVGNFVGSRYAINDLRNEFPKLPRYATLDLVLNLRPVIAGFVALDLTFAVRNVTNERYAEFGGERTFSRGEFGFNPSPTRSYEGVLRVTVTR
jgi:iron complex outermembrane receptor protein